MARARVNVLRVVLVLVGLVLLAAAWVSASSPRPMGDRVEAAPGVTGVISGRAYAWILRTRSGAALIDTGLDREATTLLAELRAQGVEPGQVHTILLTHGHVDHWAAVKVFPSARVLAGGEDLPFMKGERRFTAVGPKLHAMMGGGGLPELPSGASAVTDGQVLDVDGEEVKAIHVPGHTPGSMAFLWKDLLFTGDSLIGSADGVKAAARPFSEDAAQNRRSLEKLRDLPFTRIADGHVGVTADARSRLRRLLED